MGFCIYNEEHKIIYKTVLKNNQKVNFHFLGTGCKSCLKKGFLKLSPSSVYSRFNSSLKNLSAEYLKHLTDTDNINHLALGASYCVEQENGMAVARYYKDSEKSRYAEIAVTVLDRYQNLGLGKILLSLLIKYGYVNRIKYFYGYVKPDNLLMIELLKKLRFKFKKNKNEGELKFAQLKLKKAENTVSEILRQNSSDNRLIHSLLR